LGQTNIQSLQQFCSSSRLARLSPEELARLSEVDLCAPSSIDIDLNQTPAENEQRLRKNTP